MFPHLVTQALALIRLHAAPAAVTIVAQTALLLPVLAHLLAHFPAIVLPRIAAAVAGEAAGRETKQGDEEQGKDEAGFHWVVWPEE